MDKACCEISYSLRFDRC